jgi:hypothetical protein
VPGVIRSLWGLYGALFLVFSLSVSADWLTPVSPYAQSLSWMSGDTLFHRVEALAHAGRFNEAGMFDLLCRLSLCTLLVAFAGGLLVAAWSERPDELRPKETRYVLGLLALLLLTAPKTNEWLAAMSAIAPNAQPAFAGSPAYWLFTIAVSTMLVTRYIAYGTHDLAALAIRLNESGALRGLTRRPVGAAGSVGQMDGPSLSPHHGRTAAE